MARVVKQAEFARMIGRSRATITIYKKGGLLDASCFDENGLVIVDAAIAALKDRLDPVQNLVNGKPLPDVDPEFYLPKPGKVEPGSGVSDDLMMEKLRAARYQNLEREEKRREAAGIYVRASDVSGQFVQALDQTVSSIENALTELADALAKRHSDIVPRDELFFLRDWFKGVRERTSKISAAMAERLPRFEQDSIDDDGDIASFGSPSGGGTDGADSKAASVA